MKKIYIFLCIMFIGIVSFVDALSDTTTASYGKDVTCVGDFTAPYNICSVLTDGVWNLTIDTGAVAYNKGANASWTANFTVDLGVESYINATGVSHNGNEYNITDVVILYSDDNITYTELGNYTESDTVLGYYVMGTSTVEVTARYWRYVVHATNTPRDWSGVSEIFIWNQTGVTSLELNIITPIDGEHFNGEVYINVSISVIGNCSINSSNFSIDWRNTSFYSYLNNTLLSEGSHYILVNCSNTTLFNNDTINFIIDTTDPIIIPHPHLENNVTVVAIENLTTQINFTDNIEIYSINITLGNGSMIFGKSNLGVSWYDLNISYGIGGGARQNLTARICDAHTAQYIKEIDVEISKSGLIYVMKESFLGVNQEWIHIYPKEYGTYKKPSTTKLWNKYTFEFDKKTSISSSETFVVESSHYIDIISSKRYGGHLVIPGINDGYWVDLENEYATSYSIKRINDNKVEITVTGLSNSIFTFESIGELNCVTEIFYFVNLNPVVTFDTIVNSQSTTTIYLNITEDALIPGINATLYYDGVAYNVGNTTNYSQEVTAPATTGGTTNISFYWELNVGGINYTLQEFNQTINPFLIDNCSDYTVRAVNITVRRDDTNGLQSTDIDGYFEVWSDNRDSFVIFNLTWANVNRSGICLFSNLSNYTIYAQFEYGGTGVYNTETHYLTNYTLSNITQFLNFYLTPNATPVTFTVTDQDDNDVAGVFIHVLRYDFGTNSHVTTEILETDAQGQAIGNIVLTTQWYKFLLIYQGNIVLETDPVKITSTTRNFRINLLTNFYDFFETWDNVQTSLTFTNATLNFAYTFVSTTGESVTACLNVVKMTSMSDTLINESCITASSGTILVNIGTPIDETYKAIGFLRINPENPDKVTDVKFVSYNMGYKKWGKDGIFAAFFVRMSLVMIGIWNPMIAIILLILADVGMISMGLYKMNVQVFIFYILLGAITLYRVNRK